jgi:hypothetical protein
MGRRLRDRSRNVYVHNRAVYIRKLYRDNIKKVYTDELEKDWLDRHPDKDWVITQHLRMTTITGEVSVSHEHSSDVEQELARLTRLGVIDANVGSVEDSFYKKTGYLPGLLESVPTAYDEVDPVILQTSQEALDANLRMYNYRIPFRIGKEDAYIRLTELDLGISPTLSELVREGYDEIMHLRNDCLFAFLDIEEEIKKLFDPPDDLLSEEESVDDIRIPTNTVTGAEWAAKLQEWKEAIHTEEHIEDNPEFVRIRGAIVNEAPVDDEIKSHHSSEDQSEPFDAWGALEEQQ